ncbi:predicted protein [Naegleria gruberi]|uniref:Predicted protein n=1 Tax=Naegleria gruberi TaxID=5762 RepID=D2VWI3_NAEGR|nr:uncharacterized protein NAEGRDRAFT_73390 [Naegleria gruberi]EFC38899.1 predicted protein [Naegleria gruberi]|eukprot:XP_002671643.1 predicted protein [Naegleria gruberi strain NEG-M]
MKILGRLRLVRLVTFVNNCKCCAPQFFTFKQPTPSKHFHMTRYLRNFDQGSNEEGKESNWKKFTNIWITWSGSLAIIFSVLSAYQTYNILTGIHEDNQNNEYLPLEKEIRSKLAQPFIPTTPMINGMKLLPKAGSEVLGAMFSYDCVNQLAYISGPSNSGKSMSVEKALENRRNVIYIPLRANMPYQNILLALGISQRRTDESDVPIARIMVALKNILQQLKKEANYGTPVSIIVVSDYIANDPDCKIIAGNLLQFVEEQLATGVHVSSNFSTFTDLRKLSGHTSRLKKYTFSYTTQTELEQYPFLRNDDIKKLGGHFGQIYSVLKELIPIMQDHHPSLKSKPHNEIISDIVNGHIQVPAEDIKKVVDGMIRTEAIELANIIGIIYDNEGGEIVDVLDLIAGNNSFFPSTAQHRKICSKLVEQNILGQSTNDESLFTWHRPIMKYAYTELPQLFTIFKEHKNKNSK